MNEHILCNKLFTLILFIDANMVKLTYIIQVCTILRQFNFLPKFLHHFQFVITIKVENVVFFSVYMYFEFIILPQIQMSCSYLTRPTQIINQSINHPSIHPSIHYSFIHSFISCTLRRPASHCAVLEQSKNFAHAYTHVLIKQKLVMVKGCLCISNKKINSHIGLSNMFFTIISIYCVGGGS